MRKRHVLLAAVVAGLAALGTVVAQQPGAYPPPTGYTPPPTGGSSRATQPQGSNLPATTVRQFSDWTPGTPQPGYTPQPPNNGVRQAGAFQPQPPAGFNTPPGARRPTAPVVAGAGGVRPAGGVDIPPPSMDIPTFRPGSGATPPPPAGAVPPPSGALPPPSISLEPDSKFLTTPPYPATDLKPATPLVPPAPSTAPPLPAVPNLPLVPVPPSGSGPKPLPPFNPGAPAATVPLLPSSPPSADLVPPPAGVPPVPGGATGAPLVPLPGAAPAAPALPVAGVLPSRLAPSVLVEAVCPETVVFGQELKYEIVVKNTGSVAVASVRVEDEIPAGARFVGSDPQAEVNGDRVAWLFGTLEPGAERRIAVRVKPTDEGDVRSRATVTFAASVDAKSRVTRPRLTASIVGEDEVARAGEATTFNIKVTNSGTGPATKMLLQARLSDGLLHPQGMVIEAELANVMPGETKTLPLKVSAAKAGLQWCQISIVAAGSQDATAKASVNVVEPVLVVKQAGPVKCLVRAEPVYTIELSNPGTAATDPIQLTTVLPDGFDFVAASDGGDAKPANRSIVWALPSLAPGSVRSVSLKLRAVSASDTLLRTFAQTVAPQPAPGGVAPAGAVAVRAAGRTLESKAETAIKAEGVAAIRFEVLDVEDPVEVGKEAMYEIRVINQGTGECTNVQLAAVMADGTAFVGGNGPTQVKAQGQQLVFEPMQKLAAKGEAIYKVRVRGNMAGDLRFAVQLKCDQVTTPISKEESTKFYKE